MSKTIADSFYEYFELVPAISDNLREEVYRLRYQVFCQEIGYWPTDLYPGGLEYDEYDARSEHFLVRHRETGRYAATTRLILPVKDNLEELFLSEKHAVIDRPDILEGVPRHRIAEASRFCASTHFKRRKGEQNTVVGVVPDDWSSHLADNQDHRHAPISFTLPLLACLVRISIKYGITHWYAFMDPFFSKMIVKLGITCVPIGPFVEYCGKRRPYVVKVADVLSGTQAKDTEVWELLTNYGRFWEEDKASPAPDAERGECSSDQGGFPPPAPSGAPGI